MSRSTTRDLDATATCYGCDWQDRAWTMTATVRRMERAAARHAAATGHSVTFRVERSRTVQWAATPAPTTGEPER